MGGGYRKQLPEGRRRIGGVKPNRGASAAQSIGNWIIEGNSIFIWLFFFHLIDTIPYISVQDQSGDAMPMSTASAMRRLLFLSFFVWGEGLASFLLCGNCIPQECPSLFLLLVIFLLSKRRREGTKQRQLPLCRLESFSNLSTGSTSAEQEKTNNI